MPDVENPYAHRSCPQCSRRHLLKEGELCPWCQSPTDFLQKARSVRASVDAAGEDSTNPPRIADGTAGHNIALPGVAGEAIGKDAYGGIKREWRPVLNSEIASTRQLREMGKRAGLRLLEAPKRAVGR